MSNACETFLRYLAPSAGCASLHNRCAAHVQALRPRAIAHAPSPTPPPAGGSLGEAKAMPGEGERARPADDYVVVEAPGAQHLEPPLDPETASGTVTNIGYFALPRHYHAPRHSRLYFWAVEVTLPILVCSLGVLFSVATLVLLVRRKGGMWDHGRGGGLGQRADLGGWKERCATGRGKVQSEALGEWRPHSSLSIEYPLLPFCSTTPSPKGSRQGTGSEAGLPFWGLSARSDASRQDTRRSKGTLPPQRLAASSSHLPSCNPVLRCTSIESTTTILEPCTQSLQFMCTALPTELVSFSHSD